MVRVVLEAEGPTAWGSWAQAALMHELVYFEAATLCSNCGFGYGAVNDGKSRRYDASTSKGSYFGLSRTCTAPLSFVSCRELAP